MGSVIVLLAYISLLINAFLCIAGSDYVAKSVELLFTEEEHFMRMDDNQLQHCASISLIDDDLVESSLKSFRVGLMTDHPHVIIGGTNATVNILDDDGMILHWNIIIPVISTLIPDGFMLCDGYRSVYL